MEQLVQQRTTSVVALAAALWRTTPDWEAFDPYPALLFILDELSARGLVKYRIEDHFRRPSQRMAWDIHLTQQGWALMGYPHRHVEAGSYHSGYGQRLESEPGIRVDYTNYRHHDTEARGGDIEVEDFATHRDHYPHHIHDYGDDMTMAQNQPGRNYTRITPEIEGRILGVRERQPLTSYADIADITGYPERTVRYVLVDLPRLRRTATGTEEEVATSLKERVFNLIKDASPDPITNVKELRDVLGMADSEHEVVHVLHSLHTQGRIDFDERGNGRGTATYHNIRLHKRGSNAKPKVGPRGHETLTPVTDETPKVRLNNGTYVESDEPDKMTVKHDAPPQPEGYPLLDALLERERNRLDHDNKGMSYVVAAEAIEKVDPDMARELMAKAEALNIPFPSPLEQEYLRYVAANPAAQKGAS
jgi:hypothetical protein